MKMNPIIEALYAGKSEDGLEKIAGADAVELLVELEKMAAVEGIDLSQFSDDEIAALMVDVISGEDGVYKVASAEEQFVEGQYEGADIAEQGYEFGRAQALGFFEELNELQKVASYGDFTPEVMEELAQCHANDILVQLNQLTDESIIEEVNSREKVANLLSGMEVSDEVDQYITARTEELLDEAGWDVEKIAMLLTAIRDLG
jgi:hypothetical protein